MEPPDGVVWEQQKQVRRSERTEDRAARRTTEHITRSAKRLARRLGGRRTQVWVPLDKVPVDPITADAYQRACERGVKAWRSHDPDREGAMALEAYIDARIYGGDSKDFFEHPLSMGKRTVFDFLAAMRSSTDTKDQRAAFKAMGHHPLDFDTILHCAQDHYGSQSGYADDAVDANPDDDEDEKPGPVDTRTPSVEDAVQLRLFTTDDLNEVEGWVWWLKFAGFTNAQVADRVPWDVLVASGYEADYLRTGDVAVKVSRLHAKAVAKAQDFGVES